MKGLAALFTMLSAPPVRSAFSISARRLATPAIMRIDSVSSRSSRSSVSTRAGGIYAVAAVEGAELAELEGQIKAQGLEVGKAKESGDKSEIDAAVAVLLELKSKLPEGHEMLMGGRKAKKAAEKAKKAAAKEDTKAASKEDGPTMDDVINVCKRRGIIFQSSEVGARRILNPAHATRDSLFLFCTACSALPGVRRLCRLLRLRPARRGAAQQHQEGVVD